MDDITGESNFMKSKINKIWQKQADLL